MRKPAGNYHIYSIRGKTTALVPEFAVEDLPSVELQPTTPLHIYIYIYIYGTKGDLGFLDL